MFLDVDRFCQQHQHRMSSLRWEEATEVHERKLPFCLNLLQRNFGLCIKKGFLVF
ncbi:hypothetical protein BDN70DRAFT_884801 [Pholiota conissans]|uniref:Uncharacterized protein n=1 Tax=Pholiota conissans TaxID=109636 RepID=A0A9P5YSP0_9AGAR|nr:hypothetical protein BDN70DRAFT_884801 [Pholiota conissans]